MRASGLKRVALPEKPCREQGFAGLIDLNFLGDLLSTDSIAFMRIDLEQIF
jgi:hypothetical protein